MLLPPRKLHKERRLDFEAAFARARSLGQGDYADYSGGSQFPRPMKRFHGLIIPKRATILADARAFDLGYLQGFLCYESGRLRGPLNSKFYRV